MIGRDREAQIILKEYEAAATGEFRSLFISGVSGIGKTRLIQELQKPIVGTGVILRLVNLMYIKKYSIQFPDPGL